MQESLAKEYAGNVRPLALPRVLPAEASVEQYRDLPQRPFCIPRKRLHHLQCRGRRH